MKIEFTIIPKDKCPLDVLAELGEKISSAWIFLHRDVVRELQVTSERYLEHCNSFTLEWNECPKSPARSINIPDSSHHLFWFEVLEINAADIAFKTPPIEPKEIFFLKMEE